jgi:hypothetical protein
MSSFSVWHITIFFLFFVLPQLPAYWVIKRAGWPGWHFFIAVIPLVGLVWLWAFAFGKWSPRGGEIVPNLRT